MSIEPREYIANDKRLPTTLSGDSGKTLTVSVDEEGYEHVDVTTLTGQIIMWPLDAPPTGYLMCNGATYNYDDYPALGALMGGSSGGTFGVPDVTFAKNSKGTNTNTTEAEDVGTHGHDAGDLAAHTHDVNVSSVAAHTHSLSVNSNGAHTHAYAMDLDSNCDGSGNTRYQGANYPNDAHYTTSSNGSHTHSGTASSGGSHSHTATADASADITGIQDHVGTNQPACTLVNFCIRT